MSVYKGSRYENCKYTGIVGKDLITRKYVHGRIPYKFEDVSANWVQHEVTAGEELDQLAFSYGAENVVNAKRWWLIAEVNNILWPLDVPPGTKLVIPSNLLNRR